MKTLLKLLLTATLLAGGALTAKAASETAPKTVMHVVTVAWKEGTSPEKIRAALDGAAALPENYKGITRVWTRTLKAQGGKANVIAMEFVDQAAFKAYTDSPAQKEWYKVYLDIRAESTTFDVTN